MGRLCRAQHRPGLRGLIGVPCRERNRERCTPTFVAPGGRAIAHPGAHHCRGGVGLAMLGFTARVGVPPIRTAGLVLFCALVIGAIAALAANLAVLAVAVAIAVLVVGVARWVVNEARARESVRPAKPLTTDCAIDQRGGGNSRVDTTGPTAPAPRSSPTARRPRAHRPSEGRSRCRTACGRHGLGRPPPATAGTR